MAVKMRNWPPRSSTRKFLVALKPLQLQGFPYRQHIAHKFIAIKIKWKGEPKLFPFQSSQKQHLSARKILDKSPAVIHWDEDPWFHNTCCFSVVSSPPDQKFGPWEIAFSLLYGEGMDSKAKTEVIGRVSMNIAEIACRMDNSFVEQKLPLSLRVDGITEEATLTVLFNFVESRETLGSTPIPQGGSTTCSQVKGSSDNEHKKTAKARRRSLSHEEESQDELGPLEGKDAASNNMTLQSIGSSAVSGVAQDSDKKEGWFPWRSRRFSFKRARNKEENLDEKAENCSNQGRIDVVPESTASHSVESFTDPASQIDDPTKPCSGSDIQHKTAGVWEEMELISRDGQARLKAPVFFASFDQCSDKAAGESACTALVAVISHWLHSNRDCLPSQPEFDNLIMQGSSEWRKLCEEASYVNEFPNKHFDLDTILRADVRPISIAQDKSFVGFFGADMFESLKGVMSFDEIWSEISGNNAAADDSTPRIYIVSWNDHFFVLKAEEKAYYIIDTLGERLFEGCNQAFILRFDGKAIMQRHSVKEPKTELSLGCESREEKEDEEIICTGKECCGEFIKRFLAAVPQKELEEEEKKKAVSYYSLHQRLQIEFNYSHLSSTAPPSLTSSPVSSRTTDTTTTSE